MFCVWFQAQPQRPLTLTFGVPPFGYPSQDQRDTNDERGAGKWGEHQPDDGAAFAPPPARRCVDATAVAHDGGRAALTELRGLLA